MHVIILLLILLLVCFLIAHWQISLPALLFLVYVGSIFARDTPIQNKFRFHSLWWLFLLMVIGGILYREEVADFTGDLVLDYTQKSDLMVSRGISEIDPACIVDKALGDSLEAMDGEHLFGGLEVGMSPFEAVWHISKTGGMDHFHIGKVEFGLSARSYFHNDLYGIMMYYLTMALQPREVIAMCKEVLAREENIPSDEANRVRDLLEGIHEDDNSFVLYGKIK